ncbi:MULTISPECIES: spore photoproduct lyase family protein [Clostridia]|uniref:SPL family radical SAM protein n=1 Tax=Clostridia TaxID=186801 RepID=UPI0012B1D6D0|nr:spore photoproduct lyase [Clostridium sp. WB02_MRS01]MBW4847674.1 spore photoproduct lyase [Lachnospiraceae bacterium]MSS07961.1 spore photoproduct lyase [Clostridium sp. WB02_MRS01]
MFPDKIYYEPESLEYELGQRLKEKYSTIPWIPIKSHNKIDELRTRPNSDFPAMKHHLIIGVRKTHNFVPNHKVSDFLVPYTSSGCTAMCHYCYLVCNYNKCAYLRLFVNREQMLKKIMDHGARSEKDYTYEIGSNSDLVLENTITGNLAWTIENFSKSNYGFLTFPTKFNKVEPLLGISHGGRVIMRMSVNPQSIITRFEPGTSGLDARITALNSMCDAGYRVGLLIAPIIMTEDWKDLYSQLIDTLSDRLSKKVREQAPIEIIFMTYSYVQNAINTEAFPQAERLYDKELMTGRGRGKYCYRDDLRSSGEQFLRQQIEEKLRGMTILYVV